MKTEELKALANARRHEVVAWCGIHAREKQSGYIHISNPRRKDRNPSFTIWLKGGILTFKDHAGDAQGDIFQFVAYLQGWYDLPDKGFTLAARWLEDRLGVKRMTSEQRQADAARATARLKVDRKQSEEALERAQQRAFALFLEGTPIAGTAVERYLLARGIDFARLPKGPRGGDRAPSVIRAIAAHGHAESGQKFPCMIAGCTDTQTQRILAVHRTWLNRYGDGKAEVTPAKKVWPAFAGLVIPLWRGDSGLRVREANAVGLRETFVLTEGIEDGLTAVLAQPQYRTWAFISLSNLRNVVLPECCDGVILHRQNDEGRQAIVAFENGKAALEAQGRAVAEVEAFAGKDLNDTLRGAA